MKKLLIALVCFVGFLAVMQGSAFAASGGSVSCNGCTGGYNNGGAKSGGVGPSGRVRPPHATH